MDVLMLSRLQFAAATLFHFLFAVALVMVPIVIAYQTWVYRLFSGKITRESPSYE